MQSVTNIARPKIDIFVRLPQFTHAVQASARPSGPSHAKSHASGGSAVDDKAIRLGGKAPKVGLAAWDCSRCTYSHEGPEARLKKCGMCELPRLEKWKWAPALQEVEAAAEDAPAKTEEQPLRRPGFSKRAAASKRDAKDRASSKAKCLRVSEPPNGESPPEQQTCAATSCTPGSAEDVAGRAILTKAAKWDLDEKAEEALLKLAELDPCVQALLEVGDSFDFSSDSDC